MKVFVFRADASAHIGFGHVMRCLTLAQALTETGHACHFISRQLPDVLQQRLISAGISLHALDYAFAAEKEAPFTVDEHADAAQTQQALDSLAGGKVLIVDHYGLGLDWERTLRAGVERIMVIDDLASRHHDCDILLDQNLRRTEADYRPLVPDSCDILAGTRFTLLRKEFAQKRALLVETEVSSDVHSVLINLGGGDNLPLLTQCLHSLTNHFQHLSLNLTLVTGQPINEKALLNAVKLPSSWSIKLMSNIDTMADILATTDIAIGAAGTSAWERCCLGVPSILFVLADNQQVIANALAEQGAALIVANPDASFTQAFQSLLDPVLRKTLRRNSFALCDGLGVERVVAKLSP